MPELPDLEIFASNLNKTFAAQQLETVNVLNGRKLNVPADQLKLALEGTSLKEVTREGKELFFHFRNGQTLSFHMMLHGKLCYFQEKNEEKYSIIELQFQNRGLVLTDFQKQARITLNPVSDRTPDALSPLFTEGYLEQITGKSKHPVKKLITDQDKIKGIGNAYADEILWDARIHPLSVSNKIPKPLVKKLHQSIINVLKDAVKQIRKSHPDIIGGEIRSFLKIHNSRVLTSPGGAAIQKTTLASRSTYFTSEQALFE